MRALHTSDLQAQTFAPCSRLKPEGVPHSPAFVFFWNAKIKHLPHRDRGGSIRHRSTSRTRLSNTWRCRDSVTYSPLQAEVDALYGGGRMEMYSNNNSYFFLLYVSPHKHHDHF